MFFINFCFFFKLKLDALYQLKNQFSQSIYLTLGNTYWKMAPVTGGLYKGSYFQEQIPSIFADNEIMLSDMIDIISSSSVKTRYNNDDYKGFFYPVLNSKVCTTLSLYPQFANLTKYGLILSDCMSLRDGALEHGFESATRTYFSTLSEAFSVNQNLGTTNVAAQLKTWEASFNYKTMNQFFETMTIVVTILKDFMQEKGDKYLSEMRVGEILIGVFQTLILVGVYTMWWFFFYKKMSDAINFNRRLLSIFEISIVMENSYILSYLNSLK